MLSNIPIYSEKVSPVSVVNPSVSLNKTNTSKLGQIELSMEKLQSTSLTQTDLNQSKSSEMRCAAKKSPGHSVALLTPGSSKKSKKQTPTPKKPEIYVCTDIEADGPIPGPYSMLSFASAAYTPEKCLVDTFSVNLETLPGAAADPDTSAWWDKNPKAWAECRKDLRQPEEAMKSYVKWVKDLPGKPVFVGYPAAYDFMFVYWYMMNFAKESPFSHSALDMKTYAMSMMDTGYRDSVKRNMPAHWHDDLPHTHIALDDAIEQGALFCNMLAENKARKLESIEAKEAIEVIEGSDHPK